MAGVHADALALRHFDTGCVYGAVLQLINQTDWSIGNDSVREEVIAAEQHFIFPDAGATRAERWTNLVEVSALAYIDMVSIVTLGVPRIQHQSACPFRPNINAIGVQVLELP